jgi:cytoskeleton protein RodZ
VVVAFFPETKVPQIGKTSSDAPAAKEPAEIPAVPAVAPAPVQANAPSFAPVPDIVKPVDIAKPAVAVTPEFSAPVLAAVATTPATANVVKMPVVAASTPTANPITSGASGAAGAVAGVLTLKAKGTTWVEVTDAKGVVQVRKTLALGEVAAASGVLPLSVVVGRADMTLVEVRGQSFSLDAISKDNVARFEVK